MLSDDGQVRILNAATEAIKNGQLEVCGQKFMFGEIEQGKTKTIQYKVRPDSEYKLEVEFNSGKKLERELGSVTNGQDVQDILTWSDHDA